MRALRSHTAKLALEAKDLETSSASSPSSSFPKQGTKRKGRTKAPKQEKSETVSFADFEKTRKFELFPKLPLELRLTIWRLAFPVGQNIDIFQTSHDIEKTKSFGKIAITLSINQESRRETLRFYHVVSSQIIGYPNGLGETQNGSHPVYFNPKRDAAIINTPFRGEEDLLIEHLQMVDKQLSGGLKSILELNYGLVVFDNLGELDKAKGLPNIAKFKGLKLLKLPHFQHNEIEEDVRKKIADKWRDMLLSGDSLYKEKAYELATMPEIEIISKYCEACASVRDIRARRGF